jgi:hypothetical protein
VGLPSGSVVTIGVLEADITLRELAAGGNPQERDDWSEIARRTARETLETMRPENYVYFVDEELSDDVKAEIEEVQALFRNAILNDIAFMAPPTRTRPQFGSVDAIADAVGADALMLVYGVDDIFTTDRQVLTALSLVAAGLTGVAVVPDSGVAHLNAALIDRNGRLIWYNPKGCRRRFRICSGPCRRPRPPSVRRRKRDPSPPRFVSGPLRRPADRRGRRRHDGRATE